MVKINFEKIPIWVDLAHTTQVVKNIKKDVADTMYQHGQGIVFHALALKIYNSQGDEEYTEEEYNLIMAFAEQMATPAVYDALKSFEPQEKENNK